MSPRAVLLTTQKAIKLSWVQKIQKAVPCLLSQQGSFIFGVVIKNSQCWLKCFPGMHGSVWESSCSLGSLCAVSIWGYSFKVAFFPPKCANPTPLLQSWRRTFPALQGDVTTPFMFLLTKSAGWIHALTLETLKLPVVAALAPPLILIPAHTIFLFACLIFLFYYYFNGGMGPGSSECWRMEQHPHSKLYQHGWSLTQRDETQEPFPQS